MAAHFGADYERHPMVAPVWQKRETIKRQLDHLDSAVGAILKHLNITQPGAGTNGDPNDSTSAETERLPVIEAQMSSTNTILSISERPRFVFLR
ncbi:hypothetical protein A1O7_05910 [Cladophialophora yegresii CBS 114405]|uniref:Uncharacterized protein n=1 Tax=Cladophialophora yegresii CBS 114405 TaxID=1182544 RepID=W9WJ09_9EURO|nr:uncharacterized protein A1O7_05910 [Cladophialophora yegresii CBS 114405]EXJ58484.1 hypothetical protein A1O7_05910 [Cladophialophora yegresii CBS 114405]